MGVRGCSPSVTSERAVHRLNMLVLISSRPNLHICTRFRNRFEHVILVNNEGMAPPPDGGAGPAEAPKAPPIPEANPAFPRPASAALAQDSSSGSSQSGGGAKSPGAPGSG